MYAAKIDVEISTAFEDWIESDLLQAPQDRIERVVLNDYSIDERTYRVDRRDTVTLTKNDGTWESDGMRANQEIDTTKMNDLLRGIAELSIVGVRPKPDGIDERLSGLTVSRGDLLSLQNRGYYLTQSGDMLSNEGELQVRTNEGVLYTLRFGEVLYGSGEAISAGAESVDDESAGPGENRYLFITASFDEGALEEPPSPADRGFEDKEQSEWTDADRENKRLADEHDRWQERMEGGRTKASELSARFAPWYYVISAESFDEIHLTRGDLVTAKETD